MFIRRKFFVENLTVGALLHGMRCATTALVLVSAATAQGLKIPTLVVQSQSVGSAIEVDGVVEPVKQSTVSSQASGLIASFAVKAGDKVKVGQLLATIDDRETLATTKRSRAQVDQADAELRNAKAALDRTLDLQSKGFVSKAALDSANAQYQSAQAIRDQASAVSRQSAIALGFTRVLAPFDGWILQTHAQAGDLAVPGKALLTIYAPLPLRVVVHVPASRSQIAQAAQATTILVEDVQGKKLAISPLSRTAVPAADPVSQTTEWRLDLPAKEAASLVPGQQVTVNFSISSAGLTERLAVPASAVVRRGELTAVYIASEDLFSLRAIRTGRQKSTSSVEVLSGLVAGDVIALDPIRAGFKNAMPVAPAK